MSKSKSDATAGERRYLIYDYLIKNTWEGHTKTFTQIFEYLKNHYDIDEVNAKTFYADLAVLQGNVFGLMLQYDPKNHGYWVQNPMFSRDELRWMVDSIQASKFLTQKKADEITEKIRNWASEEDQIALRRPAFVSNRVRNMNESVVEESTIIYEAISSNRKISFRYFHRTPDRRNPLRYSKAGNRVVVSPFALLWDNGNYYMYGFNSNLKKFMTYRVDRMDAIKLDELGREGIEEYNQKNVTHRKAVVFDMYHGDAHRITLHCHNTIMDAIIDQFGNNNLIAPIDETHFKIMVSVELSPPFYAWVSTFGKKIKIVDPDEAVDGMKKFLQKACEMYEEKGEK
ncbi:MAG: WYL domain-containing protein [Clostridia bacterium]|nr:WYL domain-containing protein [Clostridia bacterium]